MFPVLRFKLSGLSRDYKYNIGIKFVFADGHRYRFSPGKTSWKRLFRDKTNDIDQSRYYEHMMSPASGEQWSLCPVSFPGLKLCSYKENAESTNMVSLFAMEFLDLIVVRWQMRAHLFKISNHLNYDSPGFKHFPRSLTRSDVLLTYVNECF